MKNMRILCNDVNVVRDLIRLEYIHTTLNNHICVFAEDLIVSTDFIEFKISAPFYGGGKMQVCN